MRKKASGTELLDNHRCSVFEPEAMGAAEVVGFEVVVFETGAGACLFDCATRPFPALKGSVYLPEVLVDAG